MLFVKKKAWILTFQNLKSTRQDSLAAGLEPQIIAENHPSALLIHPLSLAKKPFSPRHYIAFAVPKGPDSGAKRQQSHSRGTRKSGQRGLNIHNELIINTLQTWFILAVFASHRLPGGEYGKTAKAFVKKKSIDYYPSGSSMPRGAGAVPGAHGGLVPGGGDTEARPGKRKRSAVSPRRAGTADRYRWRGARVTSPLSSARCH